MRHGQIFEYEAVLFLIAQQVDHDSQGIFLPIEGKFREKVFNPSVLNFLKVFVYTLVSVVFLESLVQFL